MVEIIQTTQEDLQDEFAQMRDAIESVAEDMNSNSILLPHQKELVDETIRIRQIANDSEDDETIRDLPSYRSLNKDERTILATPARDKMIAAMKRIDNIDDEIPQEFESDGYIEIKKLYVEANIEIDRMRKELFELGIQFEAAKAHAKHLVECIDEIDRIFVGEFTSAVGQVITKARTFKQFGEVKND